MRVQYTAIASLLLLALTGSIAQAELTYRPAMSNDPGLQSQRFQRAAAQDTTRSPAAAARRPPRTALERLEDDLRSQLIRDISRQAAGVLDPDSDDGDALLRFSGIELSLSETVDGGVSIIAFDPNTGEETEIIVGGFE